MNRRAIGLLIGVALISSVCLARLSGAQGANPDLLRASELLGQGKYADALPLLDKVVSQEGTEQAYLLFGSALQHEKQNDRPPRRQRDFGQALVIAVFGNDASSKGVPPCPPDPAADRHRQHGQSKHRSGEQREASELLRDLDLEWIDRAERRPHRSGADADRDRRQRVEPETAGDEEQDRHECDDLLRHVLERTERRERQRHDRNDQRLTILQTANEPRDRLPQCTGLIDDRECAADKKHEKDDRTGGGKALRNCYQRLKEADRRAGDVMVGSRHDDRASGHRIIAAIVLTRREDVTRQRSGQDTGGKKCERVRKGRASHARGS